ncbi:MAG TPA: OB-fold domain-containing protein [Acidimicrobiales bacterium]|nr:OB-fold domain-containing protein [Acidimicrobiales bacterium]
MTNAAAFSGGYVANLGPSKEGFLLPAVDEESRFFWEGTMAGELRVQCCEDCGRLRLPPRPMCPSCRSTARGWRAVEGKGTVWSYVVPHPPLLAPYAELAPYNVIVVALDAHPTLRFVGNLVSGPEGALNEIDPHSIRIGEPVEVVFKHFRRADGSEEALPFWVRAG